VNTFVISGFIPFPQMITINGNRENVEHVERVYEVYSLHDIM